MSRISELREAVNHLEATYFGSGGNGTDGPLCVAALNAYLALLKSREDGTVYERAAKKMQQKGWTIREMVDAAFKVEP